MARHRAKYVLDVRTKYRRKKHYIGNRWHFFVKPALKLRAIRLANQVLRFILR